MREEECVAKRVFNMEVEGRRKRGRLRRRWRDCQETDFREKGINGK